MSPAAEVLPVGNLHSWRIDQHLSRLSRILRIRLKRVRLKKLRSTKWIAGLACLSRFGWHITGIAPSAEIAWVTGILMFAIYLFIFEIVNVDETAITIMVLLGLSSSLAGAISWDWSRAWSTPSTCSTASRSNAVISIIAVMIIGAGLDKTGMMTARWRGYIIKVGGTAESRIIPIISGTVGMISSFMQNVGAQPRCFCP